MDKKKVIAAPVPFIEVFGVDGLKRGRPATGTAAAEKLPQLDLPSGVDPEVGMRIRNEARIRAMTVLKALYGREFKTIYNKERDHLVELEKSKGAAGGGVGLASSVATN